MPTTGQERSNYGLAAQDFLAPCALSLAAATLPAEDIKARIKTHGANATLRSVYGDELVWSNLLSGIATGDKEWLRIATQLRPVADAGSGEQLDQAVGEALEHHRATSSR